MQTILKPEKLKITKNDSVIVYLLNADYMEVKHDAVACGLSMTDWVKRSLKNIPYVEFDYDGSDLIEFLKPRLVNSKFVVVLFSFTPLITSPTILKIMEYSLVKDINACKFNGGFAFKTEYIKSAKKVMFDAFLPLDDEEMLMVSSLNDFRKAEKILQNRIINEHLANGVEILGNVQIDAQVEIEPSVMVFSGNILKGNTIVGENTILKENNVIDNCVVGSDCCIANSNLTNSKIEDNVYVLPYCYINNSTIRKNCYISSNLTIENRTIRKGTRLKENK